MAPGPDAAPRRQRRVLVALRDRPPAGRRPGERRPAHGRAQAAPGGASRGGRRLDPRARPAPARPRVLVGPTGGELRRVAALSGDDGHAGAGGGGLRRHALGAAGSPRLSRGPDESPLGRAHPVPRGCSPGAARQAPRRRRRALVGAPRAAPALDRRDTAVGGVPGGHHCRWDRADRRRALRRQPLLHRGARAPAARALVAAECAGCRTAEGRGDRASRLPRRARGRPARRSGPGPEGGALRRLRRGADVLAGGPRRGRRDRPERRRWPSERAGETGVHPEGARLVAGGRVRVRLLARADSGGRVPPPCRAACGRRSTRPWPSGSKAAS